MCVRFWIENVTPFVQVMVNAPSVAKRLVSTRDVHYKQRARINGKLYMVKKLPNFTFLQQAAEDGFTKVKLSKATGWEAIARAKYYDHGGDRRSVSRTVASHTVATAAVAPARKRPRCNVDPMVQRRSSTEAAKVQRRKNSSGFRFSKTCIFG